MEILADNNGLKWRSRNNMVDILHSEDGDRLGSVTVS